MTSEDGLVWTYKLHQGVTFHDGSAMTADDVVYSLERIRNPDVGAYVGWMLGSVDTIEKVDDYTVTVTLKNNDAFWQYVTATTAGHVISKAFAEAHPDDIGKPDVGVIGTGPFKFESWSSGDQIVLTRNDDYWDKANGGPYLDTVTFKILTDATTRTAGLQTGELSGGHRCHPGRPAAAGPGHGQRGPAADRLLPDRLHRLQHPASRRSTTSSCARRSTTRSTRSACAR